MISMSVLVVIKNRIKINNDISITNVLIITRPVVLRILRYWLMFTTFKHDSKKNKQIPELVLLDG